VRWLFAPAQALYLAINRARRGLYRTGVLRSRRLPRPVVSIGNLSAGGAGKTPAVIALAGELSSRGIRVAVLTRGYGRPDAGASGTVEQLDAERYGDEPVLIKKRVDNIDVIVGANRYDNAMRYLAENSCDLFILDDGFQHLQIARDLDIVIDAPGAPFHREGRSAIRDADIVVPRRITLTIPPEARGRKVLAFAGLASTAQFFESIREAGIDVTATMTFPDHHRYTPRDLQAIDDTAAASAAEVIVTTEKDAVKLDRRDIIAIPVDFVFEPAVVERVAALVRR
jgi:tetraacyldisaccharide 4'-kinase